jgi:hypothetical protein
MARGMQACQHKVMCLHVLVLLWVVLYHLGAGRGCIGMFCVHMRVLCCVNVISAAQDMCSTQGGMMKGLGLSSITCI